MKEIIKRLEIIKNSISIEDYDLIGIQVSKIKQLNYSKEVKEIIDLIDNTNYAQVINLIEKYLKNIPGIVKYEDTEVQGLKLELKVLENKLQKLNAEKKEYLHLIDEFNIQYNLKVGVLVEEILKLRKQILEQQAKNNPNLHDKYKESIDDYNNFKKQYSQQLKNNIPYLSNNDKKELKEFYRKSAKLCHPDIVSDEMREKAEKIFKELNEAYSKNDLNKVKDIFNNLINNVQFYTSSDSLNTSELLKLKILEIKEKITLIQDEINLLINNDTYKLILNITNLDLYLDNLKQKFKKEIEELNKELEIDNKTSYNNK